MCKLICKLLTFGRHRFRLNGHRYRCVYCKARRYQVEPKPRKSMTEPQDTPPGIVDLGNGLYIDADGKPYLQGNYKVEPQEVKDASNATR